MSETAVHTNDRVEHPHYDARDVAITGFWTYILTDLMVFGTLFATFMVLRNNVFGHVSGATFDLNVVFIETMLLLTSSFTFGLAMIGANRGKMNMLVIWLAITFVLGLAFVVSEVQGFIEHYNENEGLIDAFLSGYYALVGTHGLHVTFGLAWMIILALQLKKYGLDKKRKTKLMQLSIFWHFLDIVWIFVFSIVYLMGRM
ncbi:MAG: cytochrome c oxidase subunit 3 [Alphaproteobacteria bacterium]